MLIKEISNQLEHRSDHLVLNMLLIGWICNLQDEECDAYGSCG